MTPSDPGANTTVTYEKVVDEAPITPVTPAKPTATPQAKQAPAKEAANQATLPQCKRTPLSSARCNLAGPFCVVRKIIERFLGGNWAGTHRTNPRICAIKRSASQPPGSHEL
ncbi:hypothetical protein ACW18Z_07415 [Limosilactobacillus fermentum]